MSEDMDRIMHENVPHGADAASRATRRAWRDRLNVRASHKMLTGAACALLGGAFWGFSGTAASALFDVYHVDTMWLMSVRQLLAGALFMIIILLFDRKRFVQLWTTREHRRTQLIFTFFGLLANQFFYLTAVRLTNAGTATVLQCLQLVFIMAYACITAHRRPRKREIAGLLMAFVGTVLISTGGDLTKLSIPPLGLAMGLLTALGAALITILPVKILPVYGSTIVTGSAMFLSGIVTTIFVQPWNNAPALDMGGIETLVVFILLGSFLAYLLYMQGVKDIGSMRAGLIGTVEPVSATVTSALMLGIAFAPTDIIGFVLIIGMMFLTV
ncbi:DMT family transporter [Collinsella tanakaei]|uniref:DMT family transporter n=1 Tax=Collinsella tanakaei TaxID=626935 RepID=UPI001F1A8E7E|nr:EamA family transporter [Collinsella tanakaei]MCF2622193.1 EamA family transporter [Collinsella tanakaei]MDM8302555.1 EamA family transporter [Collinsella tanakaei]